MIAVLLAMIPFASMEWLSKHSSSQTPKIKTEQYSKSGLESQESNERHIDGTSQFPSGVPKIGADCGQRKCERETNESSEEGTEFWPPLFGYRLKVTDTLIAAFTALLFFATIGLWIATRRLVRGADKNAERQLRAYLSTQFMGMILQDNETNYRFEVRIAIVNTGATPAHKVMGAIRAEVLPFPLPKDFPFSLSMEIGEMSGMGVLSAHQNFILTAPIDRMLSDDEISEIQNGMQKRIFVYGRVIYEDVFGQPQQIRFSQSIVWLKGNKQHLSLNTLRHNDAT